uniref:Uncharacterized protein n=1 Tax=Oryza meridionalis TaxID=40149 RepID=A0A0E0CNK7_9ORYZ
MTTTLWPAPASTAAATPPPQPEPTMATSHSTRHTLRAASSVTARPFSARDDGRDASVRLMVSTTPSSSGRFVASGCSSAGGSSVGGLYPIARQCGFSELSSICRKVSRKFGLGIKAHSPVQIQL